MINSLRAHARHVLAHLKLPRAAHAERQRDAGGLPAADPGIEPVLGAAMDWLALAQDRSASNDGGVARDFSLIDGWATSYPETTGYIIPTLLHYARRSGDPRWRERALRMADWLVSIQFRDGGFQGGKIDSTPVQAVTFNTGQILIGLAAAHAETGRYADATTRAADWLVRTQDVDGCWRSHDSPFAHGGDKRYDTHVAWGLFEAARLDSTRGWGESGLANVRWAVSAMAPNGWLPQCCLTDSRHPLTHTLGYALRGVVEAHRYRPDAELLQAALRLASGLRSALRSDGYLPGRLAADWTAAANWACLTGTVQVAACWLLLEQVTGDRAWRQPALLANAFVRRTVRLDGPPEVRGGVKGSFPVQGHYGSYEYLNWAAKFLADSLMLESEPRDAGAAAAAARLR